MQECIGVMKAHYEMILANNGKQFIAETISCCRLKKIRKQEGMEDTLLFFLQCAPGGQQVMEAFVTLLTDHYQGERLYGQAPASELERQGQATLKEFLKHVP